MSVNNESEKTAVAREAAIKCLLAGVTAESYIGMYDSFVSKNLPVRGAWVITGPGLGPIMWRVGYVCQIRLKRGQFGSDMYLIRHADGTLICHENNSYIAMSRVDIDLIRPHFVYLPEDEEKENPDCCYKDAAKVEDSGFVVSNSESTPTPNKPFSIVIRDENGAIKSKDIFI